MATAKTANLASAFDQTGKPAGACAMVLFGAAGDLTKRKLIPALFNLVKANLLPKDFAVLGVSVDDLTLEQFRTQVTGFLPAGDRGTEASEWFTQRLYYQRGEFADPNTYFTLVSRLSALDRELQTAGNYMFYLATSPKFFGQIVQHLGTAGLSHQENGRWRRVVIE
jgi:glucose-6-phosphate 1-dehydrogenase